MGSDARRRPNVLRFISDDTDFSMLGYSGGAVLTPNIDGIAANGVRCTRFYTNAPVCTPARYNSLTGHYAGRCPAGSFRDGFPAGEPYALRWNTDLLPEREECIGQPLQRAGYVTGYVGKWHVGPSKQELGVDWFEPDDDPADPDVDARLKERHRIYVEQVKKNGFDYGAAVCWGNTDDRRLRKLQDHNLEWTAKGALDFLERHGSGEKPFFLNVATTTIHGPSHINSLRSDIHLTGVGYQDDHVGCMPPRESVFERIEQAAGVELNHRTAGALWMDDLVGAVMDRLRELGLEEDTIVIYTTDHNCFDGKATCCEGGVHIPFVMQWPGRVPAGSRCDAMAQHVDFLPTILEACGADLPEGMVLDGKSMLPWLTGQRRADPERDDLYFEMGYTRAVATDRWKYIAFRLPQRLIDEMKSGEIDRAYDQLGKFGAQLQARRYPHYWDPDQLYDLENDPEEQHNLACDPDYADVLAEMKDRLRGYLDTFDRPFDLQGVDDFLFSDRYRELARKTTEIDMNRFEWYRKGWY
ncbi:MAG: sulfatase [Planctomycetota bacterium]